MKLPVLSGREVLKKLLKLGYVIHDQKGSHVHLRHPIKPPLTVPMHDELSRGVLLEILKATGLTREELD